MALYSSSKLGSVPAEKICNYNTKNNIINLKVLRRIKQCKNRDPRCTASRM